MKKLLLFAVAGVFSIGAMAQSAMEEAHGLNVRQKAELMNADFGAPSSQNASIVYRGTAIGNLPNVYAFAFGPRTFLTYNAETDVMAISHRSDAANNGDAGSGSLRYDYSTDGGATWTSDVALYNVAICRYPQSQLVNAPGNTSASSVVHMTIAPGLTGTNGASWGSYVMTWTNPGGTTVIDSVEETPGDGHYNLISNSMCADADGNLHHVDLSIDLNVEGDYIDTIVYRRSSDFKNGTFAYTIDLLYVPVFNDTAGSGKQILDANVAFHPTNADIGYISCLAYQAGEGVIEGYYVPMFMKTTDGGDTWSSPEYIDISNLSGVDGALSLLTGGDTLTTAFESDLTVDSDGKAHLVCNIGLGSGTWSIFTAGGLHGVFDIMYDGSSASGQLIGEPMTFRGEFVSGANTVPEDNRPQVARDASGDNIFVVYFDTDSLLSSDNTFPDAYLRRYNTTDGWSSNLMNMTAGTADDAAMTWGNLSDVIPSDGSGGWNIAMTRLDAPDILASNQMYYVSYNLNTSSIEDTEVEGLSIYPNPATDVLNINMVNDGDVVVNIYNTVGQIVEVVEGYGSNVTVNTSSLSSGVYFAEVVTNNARSTKQFMVK
jgi:hypothetical protein